MPQSVYERHSMLIAAKLPRLRNANGYSVSGMRVLVIHGNVGWKFVFHTPDFAKIVHATLKTSLLPSGASSWRKSADSADSIRG